jgi:hypothetical protein
MFEIDLVSQDGEVLKLVPTHLPGLEEASKAALELLVLTHSTFPGRGNIVFFKVL